LKKYETFEEAKTAYAKRGETLTSIKWILYVSKGRSPGKIKE